MTPSMKPANRCLHHLRLIASHQAGRDAAMLSDEHWAAFVRGFGEASLERGELEQGRRRLDELDPQPRSLWGICLWLQFVCGFKQEN